MKLLPYWLSMPNDHWQIVVRCSVAAWCCMLTCLVHSSLELNGLAAFLAVIFVMVSPPSTPLIVFTYHSLVGGLIVVTTWAWCVAGMKASVGLRSSERDRTTEGTALYAAGISYSNGTLLPGVSDAQALAIIQAAVYDGNFLQARSSAIWGAFLFIGVFPIWILRAYRAKYFAVMVFSSILLLIFATISPLLPLFEPIAIGRLYLIPYAEYLAISLACSVFIFPFSVRGTSLRQLADVYSTARSTLSLVQNLSDPSTARQASNVVQSNRVDITRKLTLAVGLKAFLNIEPGFARLSGKDAKLLLEHARGTMATMVGLDVYAKRRARILEEFVQDLPGEGDEKSSTTEQDATNVLLQSLNSTFGVLGRAHSFLGQTMLVALFHRAGPVQKTLSSKLVEATESLVTAIRMGQEVLESLPEQREGWRDERLLLFFLLGLADYAAKVLAIISPLVAQQNSFRSPKLSLVVRDEVAASQKERPTADEEQVVSKEDGERILGEEGEGESGVQQVLTSIVQAEETGERPPDVSSVPLPPSSPSDRFLWPPKNADPSLMPSTSRLATITRLLTSNEVVFSFKISLLAVALCVPAWIKTNKSAHFFYHQKGMWAASTALFSVGLFTGETFFGYMMRVIGTFIGGLVGVVGWYVANAHSHGNSYGVAGMFAVFGSLLMAYRIQSKNFLVAVTVTTTASLIIGYSWIDGQFVQPLGPGIGYQVFWKRLVVTSIGLTAAFVVSFLPRPSSAREHLRLSFAVSTFSLGTLLAEIGNSDYAVKTIDGGGVNQGTVGEVHRMLALNDPRVALTALEPRFLDPKPLNYDPKSMMLLQKETADLLGLMVFGLSRMSSEQRQSLATTDAFNSKDGLFTNTLASFWDLYEVLCTGQVKKAGKDDRGDTHLSSVDGVEDQYSLLLLTSLEKIYRIVEAMHRQVV